MKFGLRLVTAARLGVQAIARENPCPSRRHHLARSLRYRSLDRPPMQGIQCLGRRLGLSISLGARRTGNQKALRYHPQLIAHQSPKSRRNRLCFLIRTRPRWLLNQDERHPIEVFHPLAPLLVAQRSIWSSRNLLGRAVLGQHQLGQRRSHRLGVHLTNDHQFRLRQPDMTPERWDSQGFVPVQSPHDPPSR